MLDVTRIVPSRQHRAKHVLFLLVLSFVSGCTIQSTGVLYNGTSNPILVKLYRDEVEVSEIEIAPATSEKLDEWLLYDIRISTGGKEYRYERANPGAEYIITSGFGPFTKRLVYLEFQGDGRVFVLKTSDQFGQEPPAQPAGFPLVGG